MENSIGNKIKEFRKDVLKITQKEFSDRLKITQANMSQIEAGQCYPSSQFMMRLIDNFPNINLNWIFFSEGSPYRKQSESDEKMRSKEILKTFNNKLPGAKELNEHLNKENAIDSIMHKYKILEARLSKVEEINLKYTASLPPRKSKKLSKKNS